jgi:hypothetical protein
MTEPLPLDLADRDQVASVVKSVAGSLGLLEYSLTNLTEQFAPDEAARERINRLGKAIGNCAIAARHFADDLNPDAETWLWAWGAAADRHAVTAGLAEKQWQAMERVVEYLERDELRSFEECGRPDDHIWLSVRELQDMLKAAGRIPNIANFSPAADGSGWLSDGHGDD